MSRSFSARRPAAGWLLVPFVWFVAGCSDSTAPGSTRPTFEPAASVRWNALARDLVIKYKTDPPMASRTYALLSVGQDRAITAASRSSSGPAPLDHAAAVSASAAILAAVYPEEAGLVDSIARGDLADPLWSADPARSVTDGEAIGRTAAQQLLAERANDGASATWTEAVPTGAGMWYSSASLPTPPLRPLWGSVSPWLMTRGDQFRPEPPPPFGSADFQSALAEVRRYSDQRTPRELDIAKHWGDGAATYTPPGHWNRIAADLATWYNLSEADAARVLSSLNMAMMDAGVAVWDAKYVYWLIRPSQADPAITTPVGLPNFPSYVSGHAGFSGAAADVLGFFFPNEVESLRVQAEEAAMSRLYGGIHYRFDSEVGLRMGRSIAALAVARERQRGRVAFTNRVGSSPVF
jgi:membrane-associated phospholipid phosphatase